MRNNDANKFGENQLLDALTSILSEEDISLSSDSLYELTSFLEDSNSGNVTVHRQYAERVRQPRHF